MKSRNSKATRDVKHYAPWSVFLSHMFCTTGLFSSKKKVAQMYEEEIHFSKLLLKWFWHIWPRWPQPLTQWPQNRYGFSAAQVGCVDSFRKVGQGILKSLIGNEKVTDGQTDQQTCAKQYALSSSKEDKKAYMSYWVTTDIFRNIESARLISSD